MIKLTMRKINFQPSIQRKAWCLIKHKDNLVYYVDDFLVNWRSFSWLRGSSSFIEPNSSLFYSHESAIGPYPEPAESNTQFVV
jgi:hypothetical protein